MTLAPASISPEIHPLRGMYGPGLWSLLIARFESPLSNQILFGREEFKC
jgi:hypothetical protein